MKNEALTKVANETGNRYLVKLAERDWSRVGDDGTLKGHLLVGGVGGGVLGAIQGGLLGSAVYPSKLGVKRGALLGLATGGLLGSVLGAREFSKYRGATEEEMKDLGKGMWANAVGSDNYQTRRGERALRDELLNQLGRERLAELMISNPYPDED